MNEGVEGGAQSVAGESMSYGPPGARISYRDTFEIAVRRLGRGGLLDPFAIHGLLRELKEHVTFDLGRAVSRDQAADFLGMKPSTFSMWFKRRAGQTYTSWVHDLRVAAAVEFLLDHAVTIDSVAYRVGYADLSTFQRNFKKVTGMTVAHFRRTVSI